MKNNDWREMKNQLMKYWKNSQTDEETMKQAAGNGKTTTSNVYIYGKAENILSVITMKTTTRRKRGCI